MARETPVLPLAGEQYGQHFLDGHASPFAYGNSIRSELLPTIRAISDVPIGESVGDAPRGEDGGN